MKLVEYVEGLVKFLEENPNTGNMPVYVEAEQPKDYFLTDEEIFVEIHNTPIKVFLFGADSVVVN